MSETSLPAQQVKSGPPAPLLKGPQRAAIILSLLEPDTARGLASEFDDGRIDRAVQTFENLGMVGRRDLLETIALFIEALDGDIPVVAGGQKKAQALADTLISFGTDDGPLALDLDLGGASAGSIDADADAEAIWAYVQGLEPEELARLLRGERPALLAAVLQRVDRLAAGVVLQKLDPETATEVVRLIIAGRKPASTTYDAIAEALRLQATDKLADAGEVDEDATGELAEAFNTMPAASQDAILQPLREKLPEETKRLEGRLFRFAILHERLPKTIVPTIFREIDQKTLDTALKHGLVEHGETAEFLLASISQRLAEQIRERIDELPPISAKDGEAAQTAIIRQLIAWSEEDRFAFKPPPDEEE